MDPHEIKPPGPGITNSTINAGSTGQHGQQHQLGGSGEQLNLPPPSPQAIGTAGINGATGSLTTSIPSASSSVSGCNSNANILYNNANSSHQQRPSNNTNNDGDSDTESLASMSAKAKAAAAAEQNHTASATNGHNCGTSTTVNNLNVNAKQQRQQKRRRERAQRLQAERENRFANSVNNVPNSGLLYHASSAGSMGEDSNNSNGNFTSSSNGSNNVMPPTDSIASLLLNPPHSPECNSGLMATPSDSEGESLDEDLLSTSSSSTLLLPRDKPPPRPPPPVRRKLPRSPVLEEEIIDGFAILEFKSYEDLEFAIKLGQKRKEKRLSALEELTCTYSIEETKMPKIIDTGQPHPIRGSSALNLQINNIKDNSNNIRLLSSNSNNINCHPAQTVTSSTNVTVQDTPMDAITPPWKSQYQNSNNNNNVGSLITNSNQNINNCSSVSGNIINNTSNNTAASATMIINHNGNNSNNSNNNSDGAGSSSSSSSSGIAETTSSNINNTDEDAVMTLVDAADDCRSVLTAMDSGASCGSSTMTATVNSKIDVASTPKDNAASNSVKSTASTDTTTTSAVTVPSCTMSVAPQISPAAVNSSPVLSEKGSISSGLGINALQGNQAQAGMTPVQMSDGYRNSMLLEGVKIGSSSANTNKRSLDVAFGTSSGTSSKSSNHFISMATNAPNLTQLGNSNNNNNSSGEMTTDMRGLGSTTASASATAAVATVSSAAQQPAPKMVQSTPTKDEMFDRIRDAGVTCKSIGMGLNICDNDENKVSGNYLLCNYYL
ncbi:putative uncharacterized protein DDB_G0277255 isoform X1 [Ceratitis capitata]|uniref:putative uncharacterized protein DDB_G0277255 isoform X1 n=1 Tax=Ceratitis capitata TaxID=7213 RepID=UPI000C6C7010|nr:putative uncharacterized protein DDB_G0277255 isoform X1 [Ceratitis capitata]XP_023159016.1 putative uncharacterized protein DDB_G0277255 isoform X1 [Ceratitis capitata]XP_023159017.1 putative uncharacterized protein DDB_G0277255 isoform X1 [Ceratitis capitata]XP_023159018.1 putative uncharacterized protein DDB_G0277255 isoform X1 [Ceratitis capitata]XP_023159019.1 putative uncharacterized protein DDB_G0277255 isoform X1 [Ceratitis capitata]XP_023159020.1 putative uncharacterized protein DD